MTGFIKYRFIRASFVIVFTTTALVRGYAQQISRQDLLYVDSLMNRYYVWNEPGAVVLVAMDGKPVFRRAYGLANLELHVQNRPEYVFPIGSLTKQFTAVSVLQLAQEGKLFLQDDIRQYLPWFDTHGRVITIHHLLSHTSGIISYSEKEGFINRIMIPHSKYEIAQFFMNDSLLFEPGTVWSYSNSGYFLAGLIVEEITGMTLGEYMQEKIFDPLQMTSTSVATHQRLVPLSVTGYSRIGNDEYRKAAYYSWTWLFAAADIMSTVDDLLKWDEALYGEEILRNEWLEKAWSSYILSNGQKTKYGYGFSTNNYNGLDLVTHGGGVYGHMSFAVRIPSRRIFVIILSNKTLNPAGFATQIALRIAGEPLSGLRTRKYTGQQLQDADDFVGVYEVQRLGTRMAGNYGNKKIYRYITLRNDTLFSQITGDLKVPLLPAGEDLLSIGYSNTLIQFNRDTDGNIRSLEIISEPLDFGPVQIEYKTDLPMPDEKSFIILDEGILERYVGNYDFGDGDFIIVSLTGNRIFIEYSGGAKEEIFAESETRFFLKSVDITFEFIMNPDGMVNGMIMDQISRYTAKKID
ncbi:MAG: serine hydrolase [Bacteroidales bacterium]|nr:serine hydrolase [Bacteroidales bacterium]